MSADSSKSFKNKWFVLAAVMLGSIMGPIDASAVNVALPTIADQFNIGMSTVEWVTMSYLLMISSLLLTYGRLGDLFGYKVIYLSGLIGFTISSAICGFSGSIGMLICARALQGATAGMMMAVSHAIVVSTFPARERGRALGVNATSVALGLSMGPTLGGFITAHFGWRFIFFINIPIGIAAFILVMRVMPSQSEEEKEKSHNLDILGAATAFVTLLVFLLIVNRWQEMGFEMMAVMLLVLIASLSIFLHTEMTIPQPMLDLSIFKVKTFSFANLSAMLNYMSQNVMVFLTPFYLQRVLGYTPDRIGLVMVAMPLMMVIVAPISGTLSDRIGTRSLSAIGTGICALAMLLMAKIEIMRGDVTWCLALFGLGTGLFQSPNNSAVMGSVPKRHRGTGSAVLASVRNIGMVLGIAFGGAMVARQTIAYTPLGDDAFLFALHDAYLMGAIFSLIAALATLIRYKEEIES